MEDDVAVGRGLATRAQCVNGLAGRFAGLCSAIEYPHHLAVPATGNQSFRGRCEARRHHDEDFVDVGMRLEGVECVFEYGLPGNFDELLWDI
jgi:hypothetical protein